MAREPDDMEPGNEARFESVSVSGETTASSLPAEIRLELSQSEARNVASFSESSSMTSYASSSMDGSRPRVPSPPEGAVLGGDPFECPYCFQIVAEPDRYHWKALPLTAQYSDSSDSSDSNDDGKPDMPDDASLRDDLIEAEEIPYIEWFIRQGDRPFYSPPSDQFGLSTLKKVFTRQPDYDATLRDALIEAEREMRRKGARKVILYFENEESAVRTPSDRSGLSTLKKVFTRKPKDPAREQLRRDLIAGNLPTPMRPTPVGVGLPRSATFKRQESNVEDSIEPLRAGLPRKGSFTRQERNDEDSGGARAKRRMSM
ncbi:hypothetical protein A1O3_09884 [Capronia epimyces CBS 606.96]|uniref:Oxidoreductase acuF-like C2H2 type zinc-finger domain-containing protein n=1 Tax=Capronia epimyces CBS 606.96 TaxID=1182542 RepID=W9XJX9_9EURO|nr:uncharacterized protein A1O3_09884 [Capronia epimyces CBS 606.96]EXJ77655.1 hypothetical protein A1O3_09884 [Capronia epimyces CBS 606.96]